MITEILSDGGAVRIDSLGAQLCSLRDVFGTEYVWQADPAYWSWHAPMLFPIVGRLPGGFYTYGGKKYEMPMHGIARRREFRLIRNDRSSADLLLASDDETLASYPFKFQLIVSYSLSGRELEIKNTVMNTGDGDMLFCLGQHPAFNVPLVEGDKFEDYDIIFEKEEKLYTLLSDKNVMFTDKTKLLLDGGRVLPMTRSLFDNDAIVPVGLKSRYAELRSRRSGRGVGMRFDDYNTLGIWTKSDAPFICLEPWIGRGAGVGESGELKDKPEVVTLAAGRSFTAKHTIVML